MPEGLVVLRGGGDLGSGVALRLWRIGLDVIILEHPAPMAVRRTVSFSEAVTSGHARVEEAEAVLAPGSEPALAATRNGTIAVLVDPDAASLSSLRPDALVDAIVAKRNTGTTKDMAPRVVALGPGFTAGIDCDAVVETNRGPDLGRVIWQGSAEPNTGEPGEVGGQTSRRVLRAPMAGTLQTVCTIGDLVEEGQEVASIEGREVRSGLRGLLRGLLPEGARVSEGMKIGDVDPRRDPGLCFRVSDKALAVAGGVVEVVLVRRGDTLSER